MLRQIPTEIALNRYGFGSKSQWLSLRFQIIKFAAEAS